MSLRLSWLCSARVARFIAAVLISTFMMEGALAQPSYRKGSIWNLSLIHI